MCHFEPAGNRKLPKRKPRVTNNMMKTEFFVTAKNKPVATFTETTGFFFFFGVIADKLIYQHFKFSSITLLEQASIIDSCIIYRSLSPPTPLLLFYINSHLLCPSPPSLQPINIPPPIQATRLRYWRRVWSNWYCLS